MCADLRAPVETRAAVAAGRQRQRRRRGEQLDMTQSPFSGAAIERAGWAVAFLPAIAGGGALGRELPVRPGDRVVVLSSRPARVREIISVDIERPRTMASVIAHARFVDLRDRCSRLVLDRPAA